MLSEVHVGMSYDWVMTCSCFSVVRNMKHERFYHPNCILFNYSFSPRDCQYLIKYFVVEYFVACVVK